MRLTEIRKSRGLKQNKVAKDLQINPVTYNGYETGKSEPSIEVIIKLADYFSVTTDELLGIRTKEPILSERKKLLNRINNLTEEECLRLSIYADALVVDRVRHKDKIKDILNEED